MKILKMPFSAKDLDIAIRTVPLIKDIFPKAKAGLNSLINEPEYSSKIRKLEDALHDKKAEICKLREKVADLEKIYKSQKRHTWELEETVDNCKHQIDLLTKALTKKD